MQSNDIMGTRKMILAEIRNIVNKSNKTRCSLTGINPERLCTPITKHSYGVWNSMKCGEIFLPWYEDYIEFRSRDKTILSELLEVLPSEMEGREIRGAEI